MKPSVSSCDCLTVLEPRAVLPLGALGKSPFLWVLVFPPSLCYTFTAWRGSHLPLPCKDTQDCI